MKNSRQTYKVQKRLNNEEYFKRIASYNEDNKLTINTNGIHSKYFAIIEIEDIIIGIRHEIGGPYPIIKNNQSDCYIGVDKNLYFLSLNERKITSHIELDSPFIDLYFFPEDNLSLIIIEEAGVSKFDFRGNKEWFCGTDLVTSYQVANNTIIITQPDTADITISLSTGKPV